MTSQRVPRTPSGPARARYALPWTTLAALVATPWSTAAQVRHSPARLPDFGQEWRWVDFGPEAGLPPGVVQEMVEVDSIPWVRSDAGVAWYDGFQWRPARVGSAPLSGTATSLARDGVGSVLVVQDGRIYRGDTEGLQPVSVDGLGAAVGAVRAVPLSGGDFLVTTEGLPPRLWVVRSGRAQPVDSLPPLTESRALWRTRAGHVWVSTRRGMREWSPGGWIARDSLAPADRMGSLVVEGRAGTGFVYLAGGVDTRGLFSFHGTAPFTRETSEGDNTLWSGDVSDHGLAILAYETGDIRAWVEGAWTSVSLPPSRGSGVRFVHFSPPRDADDASGADVWFATSRGLHLYRRSRSRWSVMRLPFPAATNRVNAILVARDGSVWLATGGGLGHYLPDGRVQRITEAEGIPLAALTGIAQDDDGSIWITSGSTFEGALRWDGHTWSAATHANGKSVGYLHRIFHGPDGALWMASLGRPDSTGAGLYRRRPDGTIDDVTARLSMPRERVYSVAWAPDGAAWVAEASGLVRIRDDKAMLFPARPDDPGPYSRLWDVAVDREGRPWVAWNPSNAAGVAYLEGGTYHSVDQPGPRTTRRVWSLLFDDDGALWLGTEGGVLSYRDGQWARFDEATGLPTENVWPIARYQDQLFVGTKGGGLVRMNRGERSNPPPRVVLDTVTVSAGVAKVRFSALAYWGELLASAIETHYRLDGGEWTPWSTTRSDVYPALDPGPHTVEVQAKGLFGGLSTPAAQTFTVPLPFVRRPGFAIPVGTLVVLLAALSGVFIARRRRHDAELREREQRLRALVETAPDAIGILDMDAERFVDANDNALHLLGLTRDELATVDPATMAPEWQPDGANSAETFRAMVEEVLAGETLVLLWTILGADGVAIPCELRLARLASDGSPLVRVSLVDIREKLATEIRRSELEEQLRQSQKLEAVGQLTGGVAHDFNNLLTVIRGNLELLDEETTFEGETRGLITGALEAAARSARLTQRLLAFSRRQTLAPAVVDPRALLDGLEELFRRTLSETVRLELSVEPDVGPVVVDRTQLESALLNLVINARDALPEGGTIHIDAGNVHGGGPGEGAPEDLWSSELVRISVRDDGVGMSPDILSRVFDPFFTTKAVGQGTGLGLSMVYGFVAQSGGTVTIDSVPSEGTTVTLFFPRAST